MEALHFMSVLLTIFATFTSQRLGKPENRVSELFRYRNSPEGCETKRTIRCFIGERGGLAGFTRGVVAWPRQLGTRLGRRHRSLNINLCPFAIGT